MSKERVFTVYFVVSTTGDAIYHMKATEAAAKASARELTNDGRPSEVMKVIFIGEVL